MKRNILVAAGIALVLAFSLNNSRAQNDAPAPAPAPSASSMSNQPPPKPTPPKHTLRPLLVHAMSDLRMLKVELQHSQDNFDGHKDSVIASCDKTLLELGVILKTMPAPPPPHRAVTRPTGATPPPAPAAPAAPPAQSQP